MHNLKLFKNVLGLDIKIINSKFKILKENSSKSFNKVKYLIHESIFKLQNVDISNCYKILSNPIYLNKIDYYNMEEILDNDILIYDIPFIKEVVASKLIFPVEVKNTNSYLYFYIFEKDHKKFKEIQRYKFENIELNDDVLSLNLPYIKIKPNQYIGFKTNLNLPVNINSQRNIYKINNNQLYGKKLNFDLISYEDSLNVTGKIYFELNIENYNKLKNIDCTFINSDNSNLIFEYSFDNDNILEDKLWSVYENTEVDIENYSKMFIRCNLYNNVIIDNISMIFDGYFSFEDITYSEVNKIEYVNKNTFIKSFTDKEYNIGVDTW